MAETAGWREHESNFLNSQRTTWLASMRCTGERHIVSMCPALPLIPSDRPFTCLPSPSCAGDGVRGLVAPFLLTARLDGLEQLREKGLTVERDASAGAAPHVWDERRRSL